jgi:serine/threonine-protein kinase
LDSEPEPTGCDALTPYPGLIVDGKYELGKLLGQGGMGWVFEATHRQTDKRVALKYMVPRLQASPRWVDRFAREARAAGRIDHPNVIRIYDIGGAGPNVYIVMERLRGETLRQRLRRGALAPDEALAIMQSVLRGVAEAHRHAIVHGDLKPENIMLTVLSDGTSDQPKVLDFGVSRILEPGDNAEPATFEHTGGGTPQYMPPEQLSGEPCDARVDIYALGVVLYEMLSGALPFKVTAREALAQGVEMELVPHLQLEDQALAQRLDGVLSRALARRAAERFASVDELAAALLEARHHALGPAASDPRVAVPVRPLASASASRRVWRLIAAAIVLGALCLGALALRDGTAAPAASRPPAEHEGAPRLEAAIARSPAAPPAEPSASLSISSAPPSAPSSPAPPVQRTVRARSKRAASAPAANPTPPELQLRRGDF